VLSIAVSQTIRRAVRPISRSIFMASQVYFALRNYPLNSRAVFRREKNPHSYRWIRRGP
jgi:hypothetical protein